jgi:hypothetical protein
MQMIKIYIDIPTYILHLGLNDNNIYLASYNLYRNI